MLRPSERASSTASSPITRRASTSTSCGGVNISGDVAPVVSLSVAAAAVMRTAAACRPSQDANTEPSSRVAPIPGRFFASAKRPRASRKPFHAFDLSPIAWCAVATSPSPQASWKRSLASRKNVTASCNRGSAPAGSPPSRIEIPSGSWLFATRSARPTSRAMARLFLEPFSGQFEVTAHDRDVGEVVHRSRLRPRGPRARRRDAALSRTPIRSHPRRQARTPSHPTRCRPWRARPI